MIKNLLGGLVVLAAALGCAGPHPDDSAAQGVVEYEERQLAFEVPGRVAEVKAQAGAEVPAGALLARLDDQLARTALEGRQSEARVAAEQVALLRAGARGEDVRALRARLDGVRASEALLERAAERTRRLSQASAATPVALDESEAQLERARSESRAVAENLQALQRGARPQEIEAAVHRLAAAEAAVSLERERLARHELRAALAGEVLEVHLEPSEMAAVGAPVVTLADVRRPYADVFVPTSDTPRLHLGMPARARVDGLATELPGQVERISRHTEFTPRYLFSARERGHLVVRVRFSDPDRVLKAGVPVFVRFDAAALAAGGGR